TRRKVLRTKQASDLRRHTQKRKIAETAIDAFDTFGLSGATEILATLEDRRDIVKHTRLRLQVLQLGLGKPDVPQSYAALVKEDSYQAIGIAVGQRTQQHGIHDAENGRVSTHAQSQRQDSHDRECGILDQHAQT